MKRLSLILAATAALLSGHAHAGGWNGDAVLGGALGGAAGAAIGSAMGGRDAAIIGGLLGGAAGVAVANHYDRPRAVRHEYVYRSHAPQRHGFRGGDHWRGHDHRHEHGRHYYGY